MKFHGKVNGKLHEHVEKFCFPMFFVAPPVHLEAEDSFLFSDVMRWILLSQYWLQSENCMLDSAVKNISVVVVVPHMRNFSS